MSASIVFLSLSGTHQTQAEETVAYCDLPAYAINIYRNHATEPSEAALNIRVYWREKALVFADLPATRSHFYTEGFVYTSQSGLSDDYSASLWTVFIPEDENQNCFVFRNGTAFGSGDVTQRQLE